MINHSKKIIAHLFTIINKLFFFEKKNIFQFQGTKLYPSEIHLMLEIKEKQAVNATRIAERFGITKGAVSQTLTRLENKGILHKLKDPYNKNELSFSFTPLGNKVLNEFNSKQALIINQFSAFLSTLSEAEGEVIQRFLSEMEAMIDRE